MTHRSRVLGMILVAVTLTLSTAIPTFAQSQSGLQIGVIRPQPQVPPPVPDIIGQHEPEGVTAAQEQQYYPERIRTRHDPAFISPFTTTVSTGPKTANRFGLSLWTSPIHDSIQREVGRETGGVLSFGFSLAWDVPQSSAGEAKPLKQERMK